MPNSDSVIGRRVANFASGYASTLGMNTSWRFFSPGPSPTFYLEYSTLKRTDSGDYEESELRQYPPNKSEYSFNNSYSLRLYGMRFLSLDEERMNKYFMPFLCRENPDADEIHVQYVFEKIPDIDSRSVGNSFSDWRERFELEPKHFSCHRESES